MKTIGALALAALEAGTAVVAGAVSFSTYPAAHLWSGYGDLTISGTVYNGVGDRSLLVPVGFELGGVAGGIGLQLNGTEDDTFSLILDEPLRGVTCVARRLIFAADAHTLLGSYVFFGGRIDNVRADEMKGGESALILDIEGSARGLIRSGNRQASDQDQRRISATDGFFERAAVAPTLDLFWGGSPPARAGAVLNGGFLSHLTSLPRTVTGTSSGGGGTNGPAAT